MIAQLRQDEGCETARRARAAVLAALSELGGESRRQPLLAKARAEGGFSAHELAAPAPADTRARHADDVAYRLSRALHELRREGLIENSAWNVWSLSGEAAPALTPLRPEPVPAARATLLREMTRDEYLQTPEWQHLRAATLAGSDLRCALNRSHTENLEVHHNSLERFGAERRCDVVVLCHSCHQAHHHIAGASGAVATQEPVASIPPPSLAVAERPAEPVPQRSRLRRFFGGV